MLKPQKRAGIRQFCNHGGIKVLPVFFIYYSDRIRIPFIRLFFFAFSYALFLPELSLQKSSNRMKLVFATNNFNKFREVRELIGPGIDLLNLKDIGCNSDIQEPYQTIEENACEKARFINNYGYDCFADDTALETEGLSGRPGVYSARYASMTTGKKFFTAEQNNEANISVLLDQLKNINNRKARFRTVICLIFKGKEMLFEGIVNGMIINAKRGNEGFGYDPVFMPDGYNKTFAQMNLSEKNKISHRAKAFNMLADYLRKQGL